MIKAVILLSAAVAAHSPQQFDLVCKGQERFYLLDPYKPHDFRLRVDLTTKQWCEDAPPSLHVTSCAVLHPIADVQPGLIVFQKESPEDKAAGITRSQLVSREDGKYLHYEREPGRDSVIAIEATCLPAPFSGFPEIKTKF